MSEQPTDDVTPETAAENATDDTDADETAAGPAERNDSGNDNPATTAPVE